MTDARAPETRGRGSWRAWAIIGAVAVVLVGGIAALGGFGDVPQDKLPQLSLGETHHGSEVDTVITSVYLSPRQPGRDFDADPGEQYLIVAATVLNTTKGTQGPTADLVRVLLDGKISANDPTEGFVDPRTGQGILFLQPGLPLSATFSWKVDDTVKNGDDIIIGLLERFAVDDPRFSDTAYSTTPTARIVTTIGSSE